MKLSDLLSAEMMSATAYDLRGVFGCVEFEEAALLILRFLADPEQVADIGGWLLDKPNPATGWEKMFRCNTIAGISPSMFAALCCAGWIEHSWFPKWTFTVSKEFIARISGGRAV